MRPKLLLGCSAYVTLIVSDGTLKINLSKGRERNESLKETAELLQQLTARRVLETQTPSANSLTERPPKRKKLFSEFQYTEVNFLKESTYKNYDDLPLFLNAAMVAQVLGVAPSSAYELMHEKDFPTLRVGSRMVVPKEKFIEWVEQHMKGGGDA